MNTLIIDFDKQINQLEFAKSKLLYPAIFKPEEAEAEIDNLETEIEEMKIHLHKFNMIDAQKNLMWEQLNEFITAISKRHIYPFSKSQGLKFNHMFYIMPLLELRNILFNDVRGISGAILNLTLDEKDGVDNIEPFLNLLKLTRDQIHQSNNLYDLYSVYKNFSILIKDNFC